MSERRREAMAHLREAEKHMRLAWSLMAEDQDKEDRAWQNILDAIRESDGDPSQAIASQALPCSGDGPATHQFAPREDATGVPDVDEPLSYPLPTDQ